MSFTHGIWVCNEKFKSRNYNEDTFHSEDDICTGAPRKDQCRCLFDLFELMSFTHASTNKIEDTLHFKNCIYRVLHERINTTALSRSN